MAVEFSFEPEIPKQEHSGGGSNIDYDAINDYTESELGGVGKHQRIGIIQAIIDVGIQDQDKQFIPNDHKDYDNHSWRLEKWEDSGIEKDPTASIITRKWKGKDVEGIEYTPPPVAQMAISVDFPENMLDLGQFYGKDAGEQIRPFREIIGRNGWVAKGKPRNIVAKPFTLREVNVNRTKKDAAPLYAFGTTSMMHQLAQYCEVLNEDGYFHIKDLPKLIGKACMFELEVVYNRWEKEGKEFKRLETNIKPSNVLGPRDKPYYESEILPTYDTSMLAAITFKGASSDKALKEINGTLVNTMKLSNNFEGSVLEGKLKEVNPRVMGIGGNSSGGDDTPTNVNVPKPEPKPEPKPQQAPAPQAAPQFNEPPMDFDDDIPF